MNIKLAKVDFLSDKRQQTNGGRLLTEGPPALALLCEKVRLVLIVCFSLFRLWSIGTVVVVVGVEAVVAPV